MSSSLHNTGFALGSPRWDLLTKHRHKAAAACALLFTACLLLPFYLIIGQKQQALDLHSTISSHEVCPVGTCHQHLLLAFSITRRFMQCSLMCSSVNKKLTDSNALISMLGLQCLHDDDRTETRICRFHNIVMHHGQLFYLFSGIIPSIHMWVWTKQSTHLLARACMRLCGAKSSGPSSTFYQSVVLYSRAIMCIMSGPTPGGSVQLCQNSGVLG